MVQSIFSSKLELFPPVMSVEWINFRHHSFQKKLFQQDSEAYVSTQIYSRKIYYKMIMLLLCTEAVFLFELLWRMITNFCHTTSCFNSIVMT